MSMYREEIEFYLSDNRAIDFSRAISLFSSASLQTY